MSAQRDRLARSAARGEALSCEWHDIHKYLILLSILYKLL
jgi:hypothetical protein